MVAINSALEIDSDRPGDRRVDRQDVLQRHRRAGGLHAGRVLWPGTARPSSRFSPPRPDDEVSRIVPFLTEGAGVTLTRGDIHYVVTEYGIAYLHGQEHP